MSPLTLRHEPNLSRGTRSSHHSDESYESHGSQSTAPTSVHNSPRPSLQHASTAPRPSRYYSAISYDADTKIDPYLDARSSTETYASTNASVEELFDEPEEYEYENIQYMIPEYKQKVVKIESRASTPQDFAQYFPSQRRLCIRHDDTTSDGNMNLRVDTEVSEGTHKTLVQLFHLRMHNLKEREFSLRRYCRDSGREVCHSSRRYVTPASQRPGIQRSMSNALASLRSKPEFKRTNSGGSLRQPPKRQDSGYASNEDDEDEEGDLSSFMSSGSSKSNSKTTSLPTNTIKLEFSNYAQVDVERRGTKSSKRYEFEYWGSTYTWKRVSSKDGARTSISYHLVKDDIPAPIAHIVPELRSPAQERDEAAAGGWVPPCSMWISDPHVLTALTDVADVIIATGLITLVDDCIKRLYNSSKSKPKLARQFSLPLSPRKLDMEFVSPKTLVEHVFRRRGSTDKGDKERDGHKASPLRYERAVEAY